jgi:MFS family permease
VIYVPLFAQDVLGMSATNSGLIMIPMSLSLTLASILTGQIISWTGKYKKLAIVEFIITGIGVVLLSTMNENTPYYLLIVYSTVLGIGSGMAYNIFNIAVQKAFTLREKGIVTASMRFFQKYRYYKFLPLFGYIMNLTLTKSANFNIGHTQALVFPFRIFF